MGNTVNLEMSEEKYNSLLQQGVIKASELKEVKLDDTFLKEDSLYQELKSKSNKMYKDMVTYRFNKLNNIKIK